MGVDESSGRYRHLVSRLAERLKEEDKIRRSLKVRVLRSLEWNIDVHLTPGMVLGVGHRERKLALRLLTTISNFIAGEAGVPGLRRLNNNNNNRQHRLELRM